MREREKTQISLALIMISQENQPSYDTQMSYRYMQNQVQEDGQLPHIFENR